MSADPFLEGQAATERRGDELESLRSDIRAMVRDEVSRAGISTAELDERVSRQLRSKAGSATRPVARPSWEPAAWGALGVLVGLGVGLFGVRGVGNDDPGVRPAVSAEAGPPTEPAAEPPPTTAPATTPPSAAEVASEYDADFAAHSARVAVLIDTLEAAGVAAPVTEAIGLWRQRAVLDANQLRRLHDGLVQYAINRISGSSLALDGLITRNPCGGSSCGALLRIWQGRGSDLGMPPVGADPANDSASLAMVERILIVRALELLDG